MSHVTESVPEQLRDLRALVERIRTIESVATMVYWDERVVMPAAAAEGRARQREWLAEQAQLLRTGDGATRVIERAREACGELPEVVAVCRRLDRSRRMPPEQVAHAAAVTARARHAWAGARQRDDFAAFLPQLRTVLDVARAEAEAVGYEREPYEAMLDRWEPGASLATVVALLESLGEASRPLLDACGETDTSILDRPVEPVAKQHIERELLAGLGFDWTAGRIDATDRAFCLTLGAGDVRLTSRFHDVPGLRNLHSSMHEAGHGIYAQALQRLGVPATVAEPAGLGLDESQSRMFERLVGSSAAFWAHHYPRVVDMAGGALRAGEQDAFVRAIVAPERSVRRIDAGEVAYNLHVLVRMRLERQLVNGELDPAELPGAWREQVRELLGMELASDREGCLQDVHWSIGQWGYFPTYALGNIYAVQLYEAARAAIGGFDAHLAEYGHAGPLVEWLDQHVYRVGSERFSHEVVEEAVGSPVSIEPLVRHLEQLVATATVEA